MWASEVHVGKVKVEGFTNTELGVETCSAKKSSSTDLWVEYLAFDVD